MIKALLFDLDGMLVDTLPLYLQSYRKALKEQGFDLTDKEIINTCFGKTEQTICNNLGIPDKVEAFTKTYFSGVKNHFNLGKLFPGAEDILKIAKEKQIKLGIISFAYRWYVDEIIKRLDLKKYFDCIIGFNDVKNPKPSFRSCYSCLF